jgi:hypothetical protein
MQKLRRNVLLGIKEFFWGKKHFPSNIIVTASHGSFKIPLSIFPKLSSYYKTSPRLLLNFSDYGTKYLIENVPAKQKVIPQYGRLIGDPNRKKKAKDIIRFKDFGGNHIFSEKFEKRLTTSWFHTFWLNKILKLSYKPFYENVFTAIAEAVQNKKNDGKPIFLVDVHDTGNLILGATPKKDRQREGLFQMPKVVISNAPDEEVDGNCFGTAPEYLTEMFQETLAQKLGFDLEDVKINHLFYGGNVIRFFGNTSKNDRLKKILGNKQIYTIQVEFDRGLYMNETTQRSIKWKVKSIRSALMETFRELEESIISIGK